MTVLGTDVAFYTADGQVVVGTGGVVARPLEEWFLEADRTVNIPSNYATLQEAFDAESHWNISAGAVIFVNIETGHALTDGLNLTAGNYGHFRIVSVDAEVLLDASWPADTDVIRGSNCRMPVLDCLISGGGTKGQHGYVANQNSAGRVSPGAGVRNLGEIDSVGLWVADASAVDADGTIFNDNPMNVIVEKGSTLSANDSPSPADFSGATGVSGGNNGVKVDAASQASLINADMSGYQGAGSALRATESIIDASGANLSNVPSGHGCNLSGGVVINLTNANISNVSGVGKSAIFAQRALVAAVNTNLDGAGGSAILARNGSQVDASGASIDNAGDHGVEADGARVNVTDANIVNATRDGINAIGAATVAARNVTITTPGERAIYAYGSSDVEAGGAIISGSVLRSVFADTLARINVTDGSVTTHPAGFALAIANGSVITANGCTTDNSPPTPNVVDTNVSAFNTIETNRGIIWAA